MRDPMTDPERPPMESQRGPDEYGHEPGQGDAELHALRRAVEAYRAGNAVQEEKKVLYEELAGEQTKGVLLNSKISRIAKVNAPNVMGNDIVGSRREEPDREQSDYDVSEMGRTNNSINPKVAAASAGGGVGVALAEVSVYLLETAGGVDIPTGIEASLTILLTAALAFIAGYAKSD